MNIGTVQGAVQQGAQTVLGIAGVNEDDVVIQMDDVREFDTFMLMSTAGAMDVFASLDGANFITNPLSLSDLGATSVNPVVVTAPGTMYGFRGRFRALKIQQTGVTAVENARLLMAREPR